MLTTLLLLPLFSGIYVFGAAVDFRASTIDRRQALTLRAQQRNLGSFDLTPILPPASVTSWRAVNAPESCTTYAGQQDGSECRTDLTAVSIQFEDCGDEFVVCRCADAEMSMNDVFERLGRVPIGLRRYGGVVMVAAQAGSDTAHAYTWTSGEHTGDIHFFGDCGMETWVHEFMHAFDSAPDRPRPQSNGSRWQNALATDTCVPDSYSLTNAVEAYAQLGLLIIYQVVYGILPPGFTADCMSNQLAYMTSLPLFNGSTLFGNNCDIQDGPPARHTRPPNVLDPSRTFQTQRPSSTEGGPAVIATSRRSGANSTVTIELNSSWLRCMFALFIGAWLFS
ncbi:Conidiation-specific protein 13 [Favolaschia claudopus]|uniref:Conidiation-specific protein 13 n=1 Tax=Favolaschia claudopus TaxID=2862362 RepID=A0AAW0DYA9_9AGAR